MAAGQSEWKQAWPVVLGAVGGMMTIAAPSSITGLVMAPLQNEFGWSRAQITGSVLIMAICGLVFAPLMGNLVSRFGPRPVALVSFGTASIGFIGLAVSGPSIWTWFLAWVAFGILSIGIGPIVWAAAISSLFDRHRGLAVSIALSGSGVAFAIWPPLFIPLLETYSWRWVYLMLAAITLLIMLPLNLVALRALSHRHTSGPSHEHAAPVTALWGPTLQQALRLPRFWQLNIAFVLVAAINGSLLIHLFPILTELKFQPQDAAYVVAMTGPSIIVGHILTGWMMDRIFAPFVSAILLSLPAISLVLLMAAPTLGTMLTASVLLGISAGASACVAAYLTGRYFGLAHFASIFGVIMGIFGISFGLIPVLVGHFYDVVGSYTPLFIILLAGVLPIGPLLATLGQYPDRAE